MSGDVPPFQSAVNFSLPAIGGRPTQKDVQLKSKAPISNEEISSHIFPNNIAPSRRKKVQVPKENAAVLADGDLFDALHRDSVWYCGVIDSVRNSQFNYNVRWKDEEGIHDIFLYRYHTNNGEPQTGYLEEDECYFRPCRHSD